MAAYPGYTTFPQPLQPMQQGQQMFGGYQQPQMQQMQPQQQTPVGFTCKPVTSREEAIAATVDFFGPGTLMPDFSHGMVYFKRFNQNTGASDFMDFAYQPPKKEGIAQDGERYATEVQLQSLIDRIEKLEDARNDYARNAKQPVNDADERRTKRRKSDDTTSTDGR